jgi:hypothetical protein
MAAGDVTKTLTDELSLRLEDPNETLFPIAAKLQFLNKAQIRLCNLIHPAYLTELEGVTASPASLTPSSPAAYFTYSLATMVPAVPPASTTSGLLLGGRGVRKVKYYPSTPWTTGVWATEISVDELKKITNPYLTYSDSYPRYLVFSNKIIVYATAATTAPKVDVYYLLQPTALTASVDPTINAGLFHIIVTLAEAMLWGMDGKLERRTSALKTAFDEIQILNARYEPADGVGTDTRKTRS